MEINEVCSKNRGLVRMVASSYYNRYKWSPLISYGDVENLGFIGLLEANQKFKPGGEANFSTYALKRITGSIIDGTSRLLKIKSKIKNNITIVSLDGPDLLNIPSPNLNIENEIHKKEILKIINIIIGKHLSPAEKRVIKLIYGENMKQKEVSDILNISHQRVSQLKLEALSKIRKKLINLKNYERIFV